MAYDNFGQTICTKKTEVTHQPAPGKPYIEPNITIKEQWLKVIEKFTYFDSTLLLWMMRWTSDSQKWVVPLVDSTGMCGIGAAYQRQPKSRYTKLSFLPHSFMAVKCGQLIRCICSTMGVGRQSRRVCFGAKPDKGFLDLKSRRTRKWYGEVNESWRRRPRETVGSWTREWQLVVGQERGELVAGDQERQLVVGQEQRQLGVGQEQRLGQERGSWWQETKRGSWWLESREKAVETGQEEANSRSWRGRTEGQSTPDTGTERRGDKMGSSEEESQDVWSQ